MRTSLACFAAIGAALVCSPAWSANSCTVAATSPHAFGAYDTLNPTAGTSSITVTCTHSASPAVTFAYTIALSAGPGTYASRQMTGSGNTLTYNLFTTLAHTTVWGDATSGTATVSGSFTVPSGSGASGFQTQTVYGLITAPQNVPPASYATLTPITVTVTGANFATTTTTLNASATVAAQCTVSAANLAFGTVNPLSSQVDAQTAITVNCTKNSAYTVGLNAGTTTGATVAQRLMASGADTMQYNLYTNAARSIVWGNSAVPPTWVSGTGAGMGTPQTLTVYGRVALGQTNLAAGNYQESTITVTVTY